MPTSLSDSFKDQRNASMPFDILLLEGQEMTLEVEILADGTIHPLADTKLPVGRAFLTWDIPAEHECYLLSEAALAKDWLRPEEDAAWAEWQPVK